MESIEKARAHLLNPGEVTHGVTSARQGAAIHELVATEVQEGNIKFRLEATS